MQAICLIMYLLNVTQDSVYNFGDKYEKQHYYFSNLLYESVS